MVSSIKRIGVWLRDRFSVLRFRYKASRAIRKAKKEDRNVYPLW
jgi:hypothetical protein